MINPRRPSGCGRRTLAPPPPPPPSAQDCGVLQIGEDEEISRGRGTTKSTGRANWNHQMKFFLIGLLRQYDWPRFRTQNAWSKEAWTTIVAQFNAKFSLSFTVAQVKQKEQDLKKEYRVVKDLTDESGFGWDSNRKMVTTTDSVRKSLKQRRNKDALLRWRDKSYPYYDDLYALYDGRYAEGRTCRGVDHYGNKTRKSQEVPASHSPQLHVTEGPLQSQLHVTEGPYNINKCVAVLEGLSDLQMEEMIKAADILKDNSANRETFLSFSRDKTHLGWLRKQI